jgi:hypothetical protein
MVVVDLALSLASFIAIERPAEEFAFGASMREDAANDSVNLQADRIEPPLIVILQLIEASKQPVDELAKLVVLGFQLRHLRVKMWKLGYRELKIVVDFFKVEQAVEMPFENARLRLHGGELGHPWSAFSGLDERAAQILHIVVDRLVS